MNPSPIICPGCDRPMDLTSQTRFPHSSEQLTYRCLCGYHAALLVQADGTCDRILYDATDRVIRSERLASREAP